MLTLNHSHWSHLTISFFADALYISESKRIIISSCNYNVYFSIGDSGDIWHLYISVTTTNLTMKIVFNGIFSSGAGGYLEIGDGLMVTTETQIAHFAGNTTPSDVTTASNAAWISIKHPPSGRVRFEMMLTAVRLLRMSHFSVFPPGSAPPFFLGGGGGSSGVGG